MHENWVVVEVGADSGSLVAFAKSTGKEQWRSQARGPAGHTAGLVPTTVEQVPCVVVLTFRGLLVTRLDGDRAGQTVGELEWTTDFANNVASPAVLHNEVLITSGYNHRAICKVEIKLSGLRKVWERPLASLVCSPVIHQGHVYWAWQQLHCLDWKTGELKWKGGHFGDPGSCIVTADDRIVVWGGKGKLALVDTAVRSPAQYRELASIDRLFATDAWPHVTMSAGRIYCKDRDGNLVAFTTSSPATRSEP
jgi:outer membrane protein assembly factor BamB